MKFSIRTILVVVTLVALFLGAFFSRSELFIEVVTVVGAGIILFSLAFGITDANPVRRTFWIGFFVLSLGTLVFSNYIPSYESLADRLVMQMRQTGVAPNTYTMELSPPIIPPAVQFPPSSIAIQPTPNPGYPANYPPPQLVPYVPTTAYTTNSGELYALQEIVQIMFALVSGLIGGIVTVACYLGFRNTTGKKEAA